MKDMNKTNAQIKELDAIINLYKDDPADGLRNKIWDWHTKNTPSVDVEKIKQEFNSFLIAQEALREGEEWNDTINSLWNFFLPYLQSQSGDALYCVSKNNKPGLLMVSKRQKDFFEKWEKETKPSKENI